MAAPATADYSYPYRDYSYPYRDYSYPYRPSNPRLRQLPPILAANALPHPSGIDLSMTFFDRLVHLGHCTKKLRTQFRCHPNISSLVRHTIYHGELVDGVDSADRPPLAPLLPPFVLCDVRAGVEQPSPGGSFFNRAEASVVAHTVLALLALGLEPSQLGVICLYKAQVLSRAGDFRSGGSGLAASVSQLAYSGGHNQRRAVGERLCEFACHQHRRRFPGNPMPPAPPRPPSKSLTLSANAASLAAVYRIFARLPLQGAERDVILLSTCRSERLGFVERYLRARACLGPQQRGAASGTVLCSLRRANVALTRAKHHLLLIGNRECLARRCVLDCTGQ